ncbi:hypothetical protein [Nocardia brevicatena]|uniref:hypothetical protein n=1 Tax=Nocardia brevicatena TaxID=37327 RepID=UPI0002EDA22C|nr:hypothetical protein [Nocardia brevicatena]
MSSSEDEGARQVELIGPAAGVFTYVIAAGLILTGPLCALAGDSWADGLCAGIFTFPIGIGVAVSTYGRRRTERRFQAVGVVATAEVLAVNKFAAVMRRKRPQT